MLASLRMRTKRPVMNIIIIAALRARAAEPYHLKTGGYGPGFSPFSVKSVLTQYQHAHSIITRTRRGSNNNNCIPIGRAQRVNHMFRNTFPMRYN